MNTKDKILNIMKSPNPVKKYRVKVLKNNEIVFIDFGAKAYQQYKDSTPLKLYSHKDHNDPKRRMNYFLRHSNKKNKEEAIKYELGKSKGHLTAKVLSHYFLW